MLCILYVLRLAFELGFRTSKIQAGLSQLLDSGPKAPSSWQEIPDWRAFFRKHTFVLKHGSEDAQRLEDAHESEDINELEDTHMDDYGDGEHALGPKEEQGARAPVARRALDKIRLRRKKAALVATKTKTPRKRAEGVLRREAARSVIGGPAIARNLARKAVESVLRPTPGREAVQTTDMAAPIPLTDFLVPEASQDAGGVGAVPNSGLFASNLFSQFLRPRPAHEAAPSADVTPIQPTAPSVVASFGREAARSVFVANPN
ncbi:hypothetical protein V8F33_008982 [Rhypophila sp. PSN 637]